MAPRHQFSSSGSPPREEGWSWNGPAPSPRCFLLDRRKVPAARPARRPSGGLHRFFGTVKSGSSAPPAVKRVVCRDDPKKERAAKRDPSGDGVGAGGGEESKLLGVNWAGRLWRGCFIAAGREVSGIESS